MGSSNDSTSWAAKKKYLQKSTTKIAQCNSFETAEARCWYCDDCMLDLLTQIVLGCLLHLGQDHGRNLLWSHHLFLALHFHANPHKQGAQQILSGPQQRQNSFVGPKFMCCSLFTRVEIDHLVERQQYLQPYGISSSNCFQCLNPLDQDLT